MKKVRFLFYLILCLIIVIVLFLIFSTHSEDYDPINSIVFIKSISGDSEKNGMGFVYKTEKHINYILTNYHVVESSDYLYVYNINNEVELASLVDYDSYTDIAILIIEDNLGLTNVKLGINNEEESDSIYYFNIDSKTIRSGIILSLDNEIVINSIYGNSFYNSVSIKGDIFEGNSGGPIFNSDNEAIGLLSLKDKKNDIAFYVPLSNVMNIVNKLENHVLLRPNLGGIFASTTNQDALKQYGIVENDIKGVVVIQTIENYPLDIAGIISGDIITKVNDTVIENVNDLQNKIYLYNVGDTITLEYYRNHMLSKIDIVLNK